ncbi:aldehyde dehydrogenase family protein [Gordonia sp. SID5947]|uniref:aldehyde dehydrogenase (NADP(+)) n=1 Tax=Gordonia sp. SID5947 TaxID=2690315 RepID=UPI00136C919C|nr:aldehyde dehydrogenase (NADP(+)) [Gordonia sp. SID5947]MYR07996.1 aldehyde dehydrogenase family protein [Gordonia sp. SID5947]
MKTVTAFDPRSGAACGEFATSGVDDVREAARAAAQAFESTEFGDTLRRARFLDLIADRVRQRASEIIEICSRETGLPLQRLTVEVERTSRQLSMFAEMVRAGRHLDAVIDTADPDLTPVPRPDMRRMNVPIGPVAVFGASNMPLAFGVLGGDTASALAAGCPVVIKGHPAHPGTGRLLAVIAAECVAEAGLPAGVFSYCLAADFEVGAALAQAPEITAVGFTGSLGGGRALSDIAAARPVPIPVYAEMGSLNPVVITEAALRSRSTDIADTIIGNVTAASGQYCTKPGLLFVPAGTAGDALVQTVADRLRQAQPCPLLSEPVKVRLTAAMEQLASSGDGTPVGESTPPSDVGYFVSPAVYVVGDGPLDAMPSAIEEYFGPIVLIRRYDSTDAVLEDISRLAGQLTGTVYSDPGDDVSRIVTALCRRVGRMVFDSSPVSVVVTDAQQHGGPYPASTAAWSTSVGSQAIFRFLRPVVFQNAPQGLLPAALRDDNRRSVERHRNSR